MPRPRTHLGDSHNFGRRVSIQAGRVYKPRAVLWEWLVLAAESPLRRLLAENAEREGLGPGAFDFLPTLKFYRHKGELDGLFDGLVEQVRLSPLPKPNRAHKRELAVIMGRSLALWSWLGVSDLHWENLVLGVDRQGRTVFGPLDVEMIFADLALPTETKLLPDADPEYAAICQHACGARRVLPYLGKPINPGDLLAMAVAYRTTLLFLERHASQIGKVLTGLPELRTTPIRVCLRGTEEYVLAGSRALWPPLLEAEAEQLERGDIPYFFRLYGRPGIHYFSDPTLTERKRIPLRGDVPQLEPLLPLAGMRSRSRKTLRDDGLFTLIGAFDHPALTGVHASEELEIALRPRSIAVKLPGGETLRSARDLSAHVSSVYLPCRCGEVRSVFVPAVTKCSVRASE